MTHISNESLVQLVLRSLPAQEMIMQAEHIIGCDACLARVGQLFLFLNACKESLKFPPVAMAAHHENRLDGKLRRGAARAITHVAAFLLGTGLSLKCQQAEPHTASEGLLVAPETSSLCIQAAKPSVVTDNAPLSEINERAPEVAEKKSIFGECRIVYVRACREDVVARRDSAPGEGEGENAVTDTPNGEDPTVAAEAESTSLEGDSVEVADLTPNGTIVANPIDETSELAPSAMPNESDPSMATEADLDRLGDQPAESVEFKPNETSESNSASAPHPARPTPTSARGISDLPKRPRLLEPKATHVGLLRPGNSIRTYPDHYRPNSRTSANQDRQQRDCQCK